jgi:hypothetical protein
VEGRCQGDNATLGSTDVENCMPAISFPRMTAPLSYGPLVLRSTEQKAVCGEWY